MADTKRKPGRRKIHRLQVMGNVDSGGRVIAAIPLFQPTDIRDAGAYPVGLSIQRLHGPSHGGETGFVIRMVGTDGNIATMVQKSTGQPSTVTHGLLRPAAVDQGDPEPVLGVGERIDAEGDDEDDQAAG